MSLLFGWFSQSVMSHKPQLPSHTLALSQQSRYVHSLHCFLLCLSQFVNALLIAIAYAFEVVEMDLVFVEQTELKIQLTVFIAKQGERVLRDFTSTRYSYGNGFVYEVYIYNVKRNLVFTVVVRECGIILWILFHARDNVNL